MKADCETELDRYLKEKSLKMEKSKIGNKVTFNDPLKWWEQNQHKYPTIAPLAMIFLAITATSAPSERIWSHAALVMNVKRVNLDDDVSSGIIFVKQNMNVLTKYYDEVSKGVKGALPRTFCGLPEVFDVVKDQEIVVDVGQEMFETYSY